MIELIEWTITLFAYTLFQINMHCVRMIILAGAGRTLLMNPNWTGCVECWIEIEMNWIDSYRNIFEDGWIDLIWIGLIWMWIEFIWIEKNELWTPLVRIQKLVVYYDNFWHNGDPLLLGLLGWYWIILFTCKSIYMHNLVTMDIISL